jgi:hypothetical protein
MREIIRLQTVLSQGLARRFERLAALAFTDIVESSAYFTHFGDEAGQRLQQLHFDLLEQSISTGTGAADLGRIVDTAGDGAFACFASAGAAVQAMMALQNRITHENVNRPRRLREPGADGQLAAVRPTTMCPRCQRMAGARPRRPEGPRAARFAAYGTVRWSATQRPKSTGSAPCRRTSVLFRN